MGAGDRKGAPAAPGHLPLPAVLRRRMGTNLLGLVGCLVHEPHVMPRRPQLERGLVLLAQGGGGRPEGVRGVRPCRSACRRACRVASSAEGVSPCFRRILARTARALLSPYGSSAFR